MAITIELFRGDCLKIMPKIPSGSVHLVCADLPYGITKCEWDTVIPFEPLWKEYLRVGIQPGGGYALTACNPFASALVMSNPNIYRHEFIWQKNAGSNFMNTVREPFKEHETVLFFSRGKWTYHPQMQERAEKGKQRIGALFKSASRSENYRSFGESRIVSRILPELRLPSSVQKFNRERGLHPTQKPVRLMEYLIRTYTNPGDTVLDNCMGSGTTGVACIRTGRNFIGIEKSDTIYAEAAARIQREFDDGRLLLGMDARLTIR